MDRYLINKIRNLLNIKTIETLRYELSGTLSSLIFSREIFKSNAIIKEFLLTIDENDFDFKKWVFKSRTLIIAKVIKQVFSVNEDMLINYSQNIQYLINSEMEMKNESEKIKSSKKEDNYMESLLKKYSRNR